MSSNSNKDAWKWKALWAICASAKMKTILWRFAHDCLPTGQQLRRRQVPALPLCVHCSIEEDVEHAFLMYPFVHEVWAEVKLLYKIELNRKKILYPKAMVIQISVKMQ
jgi:acetone carboxylase gamma subunit